MIHHPGVKIQNPQNLDLPQTLHGGGLVLPFREHEPRIGENVFIAPNAAVIGQTTLADEVSVWFGAVLRGDVSPIRVGKGSNIQDNAVVHVSADVPCVVGENVVVGHQALLHACTVEDECLVGMGAVILDGAVIGRGSVVGAGALVTKGKVIPPHSLVLGAPGRVMRSLSDEERANTGAYAAQYVQLAEQYRPAPRDA